MKGQLKSEEMDLGRHTSPLPAAFVSHGSPMVALERGAFNNALKQFGQSLRPAAVLVISAHWEEDIGVRITAAGRPKLIYDFGGFPDQLYQMKYDALGSPELADAVEDHLRQSGVSAVLDSERGWDHGLWVPLRLMFPKASIPVVELSLPARSTPEQLFKVGGALADFRRQNILILGSGGLVHNLRLFHPGEKEGPVEGWAQEFETWVKDAIARRDFTALFDYARRAPHAAKAVPTPEHFAPLFVILGAAEPYTRVESIHDGFQYANISMHSFALS